VTPPKAHGFTFFADTYETERLKTLSVWSLFADDDLEFRPEARARTPLEHMVHQCVGEDMWMKSMLGIDAGAPPLPSPETRVGFLGQYARLSALRLAQLRGKPEDWFAGMTTFFDVKRSRSWVLLRRIAHSAHHRGQLLVYLRLLGRSLYSTYGPTADTGGLFQNQAPVIYRYGSVEDLLEREAEGGAWPSLPGPGAKPLTERPGP
jgi:uncharacterized damage-inducible protein DinB